MRFCQPHWDKLRAAIADRGLAELVAPDGETAVEQMLARIESGLSPVSFEPLLGAHNAIVAAVLQRVGLAVMFPNEDGSERCPLCFITAEHAARCADPDCHVESFDHWIDCAADDQLKLWNDLRAREQAEAES